MAVIHCPFLPHGTEEIQAAAIKRQTQKEIRAKEKGHVKSELLNTISTSSISFTPQVIRNGQMFISTLLTSMWL